MSEINKTIANNLQEFSKIKQMTEQQIAEKSGIPLKDISSAMSGKGLSLEHAVSIKNTLGISLNDIIGTPKKKRGQSKELKEIIASRMKEIQKRFDTTQDNMANNVGVSVQTISNAFTDKGLSVDKAKEIAKKYGVTIDFIFGNSDIMVVDEYAQNYMFDVLDEHIAIDNSNSDSPKLRISEPLDTYFKAKWLVEQEEDSTESEKENLIRKKRDTFWKEVNTDTPINYLSDKNQHVLYESF